MYSAKVTLLSLVLVSGTLYPQLPAIALSATSSADARVRLDWEPGTTHLGSPVIRGWVYNFVPQIGISYTF